MSSLAPASIGRVIAFTGKTGLVETEAGQLLRCSIRRRKVLPLCGDHVTWEQNGTDGLITSIIDRRNAFARADRHGRKRLVAANLDLIVLVVAPEPEPTRDLINRYLVAAENLGIAAAIVCNKQDLSQERAFFEAIRERYAALAIRSWPPSPRAATWTSCARCCQLATRSWSVSRASARAPFSRTGPRSRSPDRTSVDRDG